MKQEKSMAEQLIVCGKPYRILRLLGHGKGGYSYLAEGDGQQVVVKQIHHEPCDYYAFGNKIEAEQRDYERLQAAGIRIPQMLAIDMDAERIVKEYIEGPTIFELVKSGTSAAPYLAQVRDMAAKAKAAGLNIDWFPTNFVVRDGLIWYVDYECNNYMEEWSFENWGIRYWSWTPEFEAYLKGHTPAITIREERITAEEYTDFLKRTDLGSQYPKERFEERIVRLVNTVSISLNTPDADAYLRLVHPRFGKGSFEALVEFARGCTRFVPHVILTTVERTITKEQEAQCASLCRSVGAEYRIRPLES